MTKFSGFAGHFQQWFGQPYGTQVMWPNRFTSCNIKGDQVIKSCPTVVRNKKTTCLKWMFY